MPHEFSLKSKTRSRLQANQPRAASMELSRVCSSQKHMQSTTRTHSHLSVLAHPLSGFSGQNPQPPPECPYPSTRFPPATTLSRKILILDTGAANAWDLSRLLPQLGQFLRSVPFPAASFCLQSLSSIRGVLCRGLCSNPRYESAI